MSGPFSLIRKTFSAASIERDDRDLVFMFSRYENPDSTYNVNEEKTHLLLLS